MEITWYGRNCFRLRGREGAVVMDPCPKESGFTLGKPAAEVLTLSRREDAGYSATTLVAGDPRILAAPGEYEIGGIVVTGVASEGADGMRNVMFLVELDGVRVGHLGLPAAALPTAVLEELGAVDVLLLPAGGYNSLGGAAAADMMTAVDARIAIPMNYLAGGETLPLEPLDRFLKETGSKAEPQPRLQITRSGLPAQLTVMLLQPRG